MSAPRGPKPSIAPKPKITSKSNGDQGGCSNGALLTSDDEADEEHVTENGFNRAIKAEEDTYIFQSLQKFHPAVSRGSESGDTIKEEQEEDIIQKMDEDWRLTDSALTEEVDSLETLWVSDAGLTADSEEMVEMIDTDMTEEMDAEGCDAGEALADTDGLSVGDISVHSIDEEGRYYSAKNRNTKVKQQKLQIQEDDAGDGTADDLTDSLTDEPGVLIGENMKDNETHICLTDEEEKGEESVPDCDIPCTILNMGRDHKMKEWGKNLQNMNTLDQKYFCDITNRHVGLEEELTGEPYYVSSEDIINKDMMLRNEKSHGLPQSPQTRPKLLSINSGGKYKGTAKNEHEQIKCMSSDDYEKIGDGNENSSNNDEDNKGHKGLPFRTREHKAHTAEAFLNNLDCQPRFRLISISVPTDSDTSQTSSLPESQLISPNGSDVFRDDDDLEGHIVPFLNDTNDTEQDISDEHVYEEPGHSSEGENVFPFDRKVKGMQSHLLSSRINNNVSEMGGQFAQRLYMSGFGQPALSSSPVLNAVRHKSYSKPHYLSLYPRSISMEGQNTPLCIYKDREGFPRQRDDICSSGSFSRCSPLSSGLSTPTSVVDIPPPFELAYITKRPMTKSSPSLLLEADSSEKNRKKKSPLKRFLMLKFRRKTESKPAVDVSPSFLRSSPDTHHTASRLLDSDRHRISSSPQLNSSSSRKPHVSSEPASSFLFYKESKRKGSSVAFLSRSVVRVESFEDRSRVPFIPLPLTKPRSISFPNADTSDYENVPAISSDYENLQVPQRRPVRLVPFMNYFDRPSRALSSANETDGYVDMSSLPGFESKAQREQETERYKTRVCSHPSFVFRNRSFSHSAFMRKFSRYDDQHDRLGDV